MSFLFFAVTTVPAVSIAMTATTSRLLLWLILLHYSHQCREYFILTVLWLVLLSTTLFGVVKNDHHANSTATETANNTTITIRQYCCFY